MTITDSKYLKINIYRDEKGMNCEVDTNGGNVEMTSMLYSALCMLQVKYGLNALESVRTLDGLLDHHGVLVREEWKQR